MGKRAAILALSLAAAAGASAPPAAPRLFAFEEGAEGFEADPGIDASPLPGAGLSGGAALRLSGDFSRPAGAARAFDFDPTRYDAVSLWVLPPKEAPADLEAILFLHDKEGTWFEHRHPGGVAGGKWTRVAAGLAPGSRDLAPVGHGAPWNAYFAGRLVPDPSRALADPRLRRAGPFVARFGVRFFSRTGFRGTVLVDGIEFAPAAPAPPAADPAVLELRVDTPAPRRGRVVELSFRLRDEPRNPFDLDECWLNAEIRSPSGKPRTVGAFFDQGFRRVLSEGRERLVPEGPARWKVRFVPAEEGEHAVRILRRRPAWTSPPVAVRVGPGETHGYARVAADGRSFEFEDGTPFYPVGHNVRSPTDHRCTLKIYGEPEPPPDHGTFAYDRILEKMARNGEDLVEVWMAPWWLDLEWGAHWGGYQGLGRYNLENAWKLDYLLSRCEELGIYLHLVIDNHGKFCDYPPVDVMLDKEWHHSPYNEANGGFLSRPEDFFGDPGRLPAAHRAQVLYNNRIRYIASRFGVSPMILGYELVSEVDLTGSRMGDGPVENESFRRRVTDWHRFMGNVFSIHDSGNLFAPNNRAGGFGRHPLTTHFSGDFNRIIPELARLPALQYVAMDAYRGNEEGRMDGESIVEHLLRAAQSTRPYRKPAVITEFGGNWNAYGNFRNPSQKPRLKADLHAGIWGAWFTDLAATPLFWWFEFIEREDLYGHFQGFRAFIRGEDRGPAAAGGWNTSGLDHPPSTHPSEGPDFQLDPEARRPGIGALARLDPVPAGGPGRSGAFAWVYDRRAMNRWPDAGREERIEGAALRFRALRPGVYAAEFWDTLGGKPVRTDRLETDPEGRLRVPVPPFRIDIALKLKRAGDLPAAPVPPSPPEASPESTPAPPSSGP